MLIVIPSAGRAAKQVTLRSFRGTSHQPLVVVPQGQARTYRNNGAPSVREQPDGVSGISEVRRWILTDLAQEQGARHVLMLDDDMDFCWRPDITSPALETIKDPQRIEMMVRTLEGWLSTKFIHVGLSARQGNNRPFRNAEGVDGLHPWRDGNRMMNAYAYDTHIIRELVTSGLLHLGRVPVMEDFDVTLQLLRMGYPNRISYEYCWNQRGSGSEGGCSTYRTPDVQATAAHRLAELHPGLVKVTEKEAKVNWKGMKTRTDVIISWKKAVEQGQECVA